MTDLTSVCAFYISFSASSIILYKDFPVHAISSYPWVLGPTPGLRQRDRSLSSLTSPLLSSSIVSSRSYDNQQPFVDGNDSVIEQEQRYLQGEGPPIEYAGTIKISRSIFRVSS